MNTLIGKKLWLQFPWSDGSVVRFKAKIVRETQDEISVLIPDRVRNLQWSPFKAMAYKFAKNEKTISAIAI